jgi:hypothetical protein
MIFENFLLKPQPARYHLGPKLTSVHHSGPLKSFELKDKGNNPASLIAAMWHGVFELGDSIAASIDASRVSSYTGAVGGNQFSVSDRSIMQLPARITGAPASAQGTFLFRQLLQGFAVGQIGHFDRGWV